MDLELLASLKPVLLEGREVAQIEVGRIMCSIMGGCESQIQDVINSGLIGLLMNILNPESDLDLKMGLFLCVGNAGPIANARQLKFVFFVFFERAPK